MVLFCWWNNYRSSGIINWRKNIRNYRFPFEFPSKWRFIGCFCWCFFISTRQFNLLGIFCFVLLSFDINNYRTTFGKVKTIRHNNVRSCGRLFFMCDDELLSFLENPVSTKLVIFLQHVVVFYCFRSNYGLWI